MELLQQENLLAAIELREHEIKQEIKKVKLHLSSLHFNRKKLSDGSYSFYKKAAAADKLTLENNIWRINAMKNHVHYSNNVCK